MLLHGKTNCTYLVSMLIPVALFTIHRYYGHSITVVTSPHYADKIYFIFKLKHCQNLINLPL